ncbi:MAG: TetR/AcrR family transcriptional regulator [Gordonia sp. (in: high G+C Gram-positive bacteria)]
MDQRKERVYGGMSAADRREQRRTSLIEAGLQLFGTEGYPNISVKRICDEAGLTQRYFYESFTDREALLDAVYRHCVEILRAASMTAAVDYLSTRLSATVRKNDAVPAELIPGLARNALGGFIKTLAEDRRRARVILIEVVGVSPALEKLRISAIHDWAGLILSFTSTGSGLNNRSRLSIIGFVGAFTQLLVDWQMALADPISDETGPDLFTIDAIHEVCTEMLIAIWERILVDDDAPAVP